MAKEFVPENQKQPKNRSGRKSKKLGDKKRGNKALREQDKKKYDTWEPESAPIDHPLWNSFVHWVQTGGIVSKDLLTYDKMHWSVIWGTYVAGAIEGANATIKSMTGRTV